MVGAFVEEIISPIPSFLVLIPAGAAAHVQQASWWYLPILALIGASGRIVASVILYLLADKSENMLFGNGRRWFGLTHKQVERYGRRLSEAKRDWLVLFLLNAIPVLPTSLLSLACGFIKINLKMFVLATFFGSAVNGLIYLSLGYAGLQAAGWLRSADAILQILMLLTVAGLLLWLLHYRRNRRAKMVLPK